MKKKPIFFGQ